MQQQVYQVHDVDELKQDLMMSSIVSFILVCYYFCTKKGPVVPFLK